MCEEPGHVRPRFFLTGKMDNLDTIKTIVAQFSGQRNTFTCPRILAEFMGSLEGGHWLNQLIFWSDKSNDPDGWVYKSAHQWEQEIMLSRYALDKFKKVGEEAGWLRTKIEKVGGAPTTHYLLNMQALLNLLIPFCRKQQMELSKTANLLIQKNTFITLLLRSQPPKKSRRGSRAITTRSNPTSSISLWPRPS